MSLFTQKQSEDAIRYIYQNPQSLSGVIVSVTRLAIFGVLLVQVLVYTGFVSGIPALIVESLGVLGRSHPKFNAFCVLSLAYLLLLSFPSAPRGTQ